MRESLGGSMLLTLVVIFTSIVIIFFAGIMAYSKAYKAKNKVIEIIEKYDGNITDFFNNVEAPVNESMELMGYRVSDNSEPDCSGDSSRGCATNLAEDSGYYYCICQHSVGSGRFYEVITYVQFDFPIIGSLLTFPVKGETRVLGNNYEY